MNRIIYFIFHLFFLVKYFNSNNACINSLLTNFKYAKVKYFCLPHDSLYAIAFVDYDQDSNKVCKDLLKAKDGIDWLAQYTSSVGR